MVSICVIGYSECAVAPSYRAKLYHKRIYPGLSHEKLIPPVTLQLWEYFHQPAAFYLKGWQVLLLSCESWD